MSKLVTKKKIVITGGAGGIGSQLCRSFIEAGHQVVVLDRSLEVFKQLHQTVSDSPLLTFEEVDVSDPESIKQAAATARDLDVLINAAAVLWPVQPFLETDLGKLRQSIEISLLGSIYSCHAFLPALQKSPHGKIINFSGGGGGDPRPNHMAYSLSKTAVVRLSENISAEYPSIDVNAIAPGAHKTAMWQDEKSDTEPDKWGSTDDLIDFFAWLIGDESNGISGRFINVKDDWRDPEWVAALKTDPSLLTLRRIDNFRYRKI